MSLYRRSYGYDLPDNATSFNGNPFASYNAANEMASLSGGSVEYVQGYLHDVAGPGITHGTFEFDPNHHLYQQSTDGSNSYFYRTDGLGRRVHSTYNNGTVKKFYIFDGERLLGEVHGTVSAGTVPAVAYTWGTDGLVSERLIPQNKSLYYHFGPQGETRYLTDGNGDVADTYLYTAYRVLLDETGNDSNPHRYGPLPE